MTKPRWLQLQQRAHPVHAGRVNCELRHRDVEVDECAACPWLLDIHGKDDEQRVMCRPDAGRLGLKGLGI